MKILNVSAGAVGAYFCGRLAQKGTEVAVTVRSDRELVAANGFDIKSIAGDFIFKPQAVLNSASEYKDNADYIILTTDPAVTFGRLLDLPMPKRLKAQYDNPGLRRFSSYHAAFACDAAELPFDGDLIFDVPEEYVAELGTRQLIVREFSHEPSYAPEGKNILQTMTFCFDEDCCEFIRLRKNDKEAYKARKARLAELLMMLIEDHCPTLRGRLTLIDFWTPATYERFVSSQIGSFMSFAIPEKFLPIPLDNSVEGVDNLFLATQWLQSPGGLPTAADQGRGVINRINKIEAKR